MLFHEWARFDRSNDSAVYDFKSYSWNAFLDNFTRNMDYYFAGAKCFAGWKPATWTSQTLTDSRLSPVQTEPLKEEDLVRCDRLIAEAELDVSILEAKRDAYVAKSKGKTSSRERATVHNQYFVEMLQKIRMWQLRLEYMTERRQAAIRAFSPETENESSGPRR